MVGNSFRKSCRRNRSVPERVRHDPGTPLDDADWNELQIPVAMAFFFVNSSLGRVVAGYPSPGGMTECELDLAAWDRLVAAHPLFAAMTPDVEAVFVNRAEPGGEVFLLPIDQCYSLVGELRLRWQGFDGGAEAHAALASFLTALRSSARVLNSCGTTEASSPPSRAWAAAGPMSARWRRTSSATSSPTTPARSGSTSRPAGWSAARRPAAA